MTVSAGSRLGPYEILAPLGAGGMGEVWRARDTRLARDVAIKVLPADVAADPERLKRFEREARAASALSHPNIVTIYEVGRDDTTAFIAMELVEGKTIRAVLSKGGLPVRQLLSIATQIAEGLTRAHEAGIVHRDLKPENVMVTKDGLVKILDFGLAKLTLPEQDGGQTASAMTVSAPTRPGLAMGTAAYMSPEQASGHPVDFRSDQFSLGSMLYEMAAGTSPFKRATIAQSLAAIIDEDPEPLAAAAQRLPTPVRWIIERCLAKEPERRNAATSDLVRDLSRLRDHLSELSSGSGIAIDEPWPGVRWKRPAAVLALAAVVASMYWLGRHVERAGVTQPTYRQLTFRGAGIGSARFAPDGQTIVFSSQTEGRPPELFSMRLDSPEVRSLGLPPAHILSISSSGRMAILLLRPFALMPRIGHIGLEQALYRDPFLLDGTLAEASLAGGSPRELLEDVSFADWSADGTELAIVHRVGNRRRVEFPIGTPLYDLEREVLNHPRVLGQPGRVAFKDWSRILMSDGRPVRELASNDAIEIAWSPSSGEVWYTNAATEIFAVSSARRDRLVVTIPGDFVLYDIAPDGRALLGRLVETTEILGTFPGEPRERNLSQFDLSIATDLSPGGDVLAFSDAFRPGEELVGAPTGIYVRKTDGAPPKRLGEVWQSAPVLSRDGTVVLTKGLLEQETGKTEGPGAVDGFFLIPTGPGETRRLEAGVSVPNGHGRFGFFPDGKSIFYPGNEPGHGMRVWQLGVEGGKPRAITPEGVNRPVLLADGRRLLARGPDFQWHVYAVDGQGEPQRALGIEPGEEPIQPTPDGFLYVRGADGLRPGETLMTTRVYRVDPTTGRRELWKEIPPKDPRTGGAVTTILFSADGKTCVWTHVRYSTELVLAEGLK